MAAVSRRTFTSAGSTGIAGIGSGGSGEAGEAVEADGVGFTARSLSSYACSASEPDPAPLLGLNFGFARARVLDTAIELGVFARLADTPCDGAALAAELGCDQAGTDRLLAALAGLGLLRQERPAQPPATAKYALTPLSAAYLVEGSSGERYLGPHLVDVMAQWDLWAGLSDAVRSGRRRTGTDGRAFRAGVVATAFPVAFPVAVRAVAPVPVPEHARVLDLAAGGGEWGIALALCHPTVRVVAQDDEEVLRVARQRVTTFGLADRFTFRAAGSAEAGSAAAGSTVAGSAVAGSTAAEPGGLAFPDASFDLVVVAQVCRFVGDQTVARLLATTARLLRPGGNLLVADVMRPDGEEGSPAVPMIDISLFVNSGEGAVRSVSAYRNLLCAAGFDQPKATTTGPVTVLTARRS